jgi:hypothetical protein
VKEFVWFIMAKLAITSRITAGLSNPSDEDPSTGRAAQSRQSGKAREAKVSGNIVESSVNRGIFVPSN